MTFSLGATPSGTIMGPSARGLDSREDADPGQFFFMTQILVLALSVFPGRLMSV